MTFVWYFQDCRRNARERQNIICFFSSDEGGVCDAVSLCRLGRRAGEGGTVFGYGIKTYQLSWYRQFSLILVSPLIAFHHGIITLSDNITYHGIMLVHIRIIKAFDD